MKIKCQAAVAVDADGNWSVSGWGDKHPLYAERIATWKDVAIDNLEPNASEAEYTTAIVEFELDLDELFAARRINGEVKP